MNPKVIGLVAGVIVVAGGSFYGGMQYQMHKAGSSARGGQFMGQFGGQRTGMGQGGMRNGQGGFTVGEIIAKDTTSITIKMQDGSTKIVLVGLSAQVMKSAAGTMDDLVVGAQVTVMGSANSDGSLTAQSVQLRPAGSMPFGMPRDGGSAR